MLSSGAPHPTREILTVCISGVTCNIPAGCTRAHDWYGFTFEKKIDYFRSHKSCKSYPFLKLCMACLLMASSFDGCSSLTLPYPDSADSISPR